MLRASLIGTVVAIRHDSGWSWPNAVSRAVGAARAAAIGRGGAVGRDGVEGGGAAGGAPQSPPDPLLEWYDRTAAAAALALAPAEASRICAVAWLAARRAMRDARRGRAGTAAVVTAVHGVLVTLAPAMIGDLDAARDASLARLRGRRTVARGVAAGALAAADIIAERSDDGPDPAGWRPYLIPSVREVAPAPPPGPDDPVYTRDLAEVRLLGTADSTDRQPGQTETARIWAQSSLSAYTPAVRTTLARLDAPIAARVEMVALVHMVTLDSMLAGYATGEHDPRWRPQSVLAGPPRAWTPLIQPDHGEPEYPCLHAAYAGAAEIVLTAQAGHPTTPLAVGNPAAPGLSRHYSDWRQLTADCVDAGVWGGTHLRCSAQAGAALGRRVAFRALARWSRQAA